MLSACHKRCYNNHKIYIMQTYLNSCATAQYSLELWQEKWSSHIYTLIRSSHKAFSYTLLQYICERQKGEGNGVVMREKNGRTVNYFFREITIVSLFHSLKEMTLEKTVFMCVYMWAKRTVLPVYIYHLQSTKFCSNKRLDWIAKKVQNKIAS